jgi:hypothetical protein
MPLVRISMVTGRTHEERKDMFWDPHYLGIERTRAISLLVSTRNRIMVWLFLVKKPRRALMHCRHRK